MKQLHITDAFSLVPKSVHRKVQQAIGEAIVNGRRRHKISLAVAVSLAALVLFTGGCGN